MANGNYEAGFVDVRGRDWPVYVTNSGRWVAVLGDKEVGADSKDKLRELLMRQTKRAAVELHIPFTKVERTMSGMGAGRITYKRGVVKGIHASNGNLIVEWSEKLRGPTREQWDAILRYGGEVFPELTEDQLHEYQRLVREATDAVQQMERWAREHRIESIKKLAEDTVIKVTEQSE